MQVRVKPESFKRVLLLYNKNSGKQLFASMQAKINETNKLVRGSLKNGTIELKELGHFTELETIAQRVKEERFEWVIIAGGDGTLRAFIEELVKLDYFPYLSVFPAGTVNLVAKELLLKSDPAKWVKRVSKGIVHPVYLGRANGHIFLTVAGVGFDSLVVDNVGLLEKKILSKFAYVLQGTEMMRKELLFSNWRYRFKVRLDDDPTWYEASGIIAGKSRYYAGRYNLFGDAALGAPELHLAIFTGNKRADIIRYVSLIAIEALGIDKSILLRTAKRVEIQCVNEDFPVELDGDAVTATPLVLEMLPYPIDFLA